MTLHATGDRECDLAFSELFQPFSAEFYEIYDRTFPLDKEGFEERKHLYQLYYLLNFSHRFNGSYINLTTKLIEELLYLNNFLNIKIKRA